MNRVIDRKSYAYHDSYTVAVDGTEISVTVTASPSVVRDWLYATLYFRRRFVYLNRLVVGLGVQWTAAGSNLLADTMQLCIGRRCLIFQLAHANTVPSKLRTFLLNPSHTFVGFWNHRDRMILKTCVYKLEMAKDPLDLKEYAKDAAAATDGNVDVKLDTASVNKIVEKCLSFEVEQNSEISRSLWCDKDLSDEQVTYATVDAYCAFLIGRKIKAWQINQFFDHQVYDVVLHGSFLVVTVTAEDYIAEHWAREVIDRYRHYLTSGTAVIGLAIQWNPFIHEIEGNNNGPDTLQLCVGDLCLVFQLSRAQRVPQLLRRLLLLRDVTYVGIRNPHDKQLLSGSRHAFEMPRNLYDIRSFLIPEIACGNLYTIVNACLGYTAVRWTPQILSSNWSAETLTDVQALTAAIRARCAFLIARNLQVWQHSIEVLLPKDRSGSLRDLWTEDKKAVLKFMCWAGPFYYYVFLPKPSGCDPDVSYRVGSHIYDSVNPIEE